jgi:hypothetical protein
MASVTKVEKRQRGFIGQFFYLVFIGFNLLMLVWFVSGLVTVSGIPVGSDAERAGRAIGAAIGFGLLLTFWLIGALVLGILAAVTRGNKVIVEDVKSPGVSWFAASESSEPTMDANAMIARYKQQQADAGAPRRTTARLAAPRAQFGRRGA